MAHTKYVTPSRSAAQTAAGYRNKKYAKQKKLLAPSNQGPVFKNI